MVMHHSPRTVFQGRPFDPFMPFLLPAYIQCRSVKQGYGVKLEIVQENIAWIEETAKYYWFKVSAKYCYATHELRLHQNDRCKRFTLV